MSITAQPGALGGTSETITPAIIDGGVLENIKPTWSAHRDLRLTSKWAPAFANTNGSLVFASFARAPYPHRTYLMAIGAWTYHIKSAGVHGTPQALRIAKLRKSAFSLMDPAALAPAASIITWGRRSYGQGTKTRKSRSAKTKKESGISIYGCFENSISHKR